MRNRRFRLLPLHSLLLLAFAPLAGCSSSSTPPAAAPPKPTEQQVKEIDDNPNMPPQAKEAAKNALLHHQDRK